MRLFLLLILLLIVIFLYYNKETFDINERAKKRLFGLSNIKNVPVGNKEIKKSENIIVDYVPRTTLFSRVPAPKQRLKIENKIFY